MLTPLRELSLRSSLLSLALMAASFSTFPAIAPAHAAPCNLGSNLGCAAEGQNPGNSGSPGGSGSSNNNGGGNSGPGDGPGQGDDGRLEDNVSNPPTPALPNTANTRAQALNKIEFPIPTIKVTPAPKTYVRVKTSFWIPAEQLKDITVSASVGAAEGVQPQTITATATLQRVIWDLVEYKLPCDGPGRPNGEGKGKKCDYHFKTSSTYHGMDAFTIKATPYWRVTWTCSGTCPEGGNGPEPELLNSAYPSPFGDLKLVVDEIQTEAKGN